MNPVPRVTHVASPFAAVALAPALAAANPASNVPSAGDPGDPIDLHVAVDYVYELARSTIARETVGDPLAPTARIPDLKFKQFRHLITPRLELGIFHDTWLSVALPITIAQAREHALGSGVGRDSSSTIVDGLLPAGGFDAEDPGTPLAGDGVFRGRGRHGLSQVYVGGALALMNQARDPSKPTWKLGAELRLAVGKIMQFDEQRVAEETGVNPGVHELRLHTSFARRFTRSEGWFQLFWQVPLRASNGSLFTNPGFGVTNEGIGQQAGVSFGGELFVVNDKATGNRISLDVGAGFIGHFEGRDYTEMWEIFALAGDSRAANRPLVLDADPVTPDVQALSYPGISNVENHLESQLKLAVRAKLGSVVQFAAAVDLSWKTDHVISFADAGIDLPTCGSGVAQCEDADNELVNPGTQEVNPLHAPRIDQVGHRYHSIDNFAIAIGVQGIALF